MINREIIFENQDNENEEEKKTIRHNKHSMLLVKYITYYTNYKTYHTNYKTSTSNLIEADHTTPREKEGEKIRRRVLLRSPS